ncbi:L-histidine N(alpha)-methyltransferase [Actinosynnema pretiosum subsp. pretiosum]|uniref:Histidine N-alpha-methyltransferase n=2 Tax=Actinosynnema TaxID=40566 RepID=C6WH02_ACTMD|nr:L-histidine N(alpha)-methyltransferase [Actinosynnema mirum]ACU36070.1 methyltransferase [Actinosynnema mirum DSM 43827]AXX29524.1 Dimethylhistidine N-methyltransferase [Actinosynnema pretiosum subsp. pretiosum]QUF06241.1 L-histidine N(alpha)-methyltransferase [Actinosynnema pretiosum subsp. pretiosum]
MTELDVRLTPDEAARALREEAAAGLADTPKWLSPKWFYDEVGSSLFEDITRLPEYYPTRAEREILTARAGEVAELTGAAELVELGSGFSVKTRLLLDALRPTLRRFTPLDVSESALLAGASGLADDYPGVQVRCVVGDFTQHLGALPVSDGRLVAFLGGTIGNLLPEERGKFFAAVRESLRAGQWLLLGADLVKDPEVLVRAYDDPAGVTAAFNRNVLRVLNRELGAGFDPDAFAHVARWNPEREWIEMRLRAERAMRVPVPGLGIEVGFAEGEELRTEVSAKFRRDGLERELGESGFAVRRWWTDSEGRFALVLAQATG